MERMPNPGPVVIGLGLHRPMVDAELRHLAAFHPVQHDPDDAVPTAVVDGIAGSVSRWVAEAPCAIAVGVVELHQYAGVSGGHKAVAVGCGGRQTIRALHARERVLAPGVRMGGIDGNPFRAVVDELGRAARCRWALVWVPALAKWMFGPPERVVRHALSRLDPWDWMDGPAPGIVLSVPSAKAVSLYQASRAATYLSESPAPALVPGGTIVLRAACPEGLGSEEGFRRALSEHPAPWAPVLSGPEPSGAGAQRAVMIARLAQRYRLEVEGCDDPAPLEAVGIPATRAMADRPATWPVVEAPFQRLPQVRNPRSPSE